MVKESAQEVYKFPIMVVGAAIMVSLVLSFFVVRPMYSDLRAKSKDLKNKQETLAALENKLENLKALKEKEAELKEKNKKILAALPEKKDVPRLFTQLESVASAAGLGVEKVAESTAPTEAAAASSTVVSRVNYQVDAKTGTYSTVKGALIGIDEALRLLSVSGVSITSANNSLSVVLDVVTYSRGAN